MDYCVAEGSTPAPGGLVAPTATVVTAQPVSVQADHPRGRGAMEAERFGACLRRFPSHDSRFVFAPARFPALSRLCPLAWIGLASPTLIPGPKAVGAWPSLQAERSGRWHGRSADPAGAGEGVGDCKFRPQTRPFCSFPRLWPARPELQPVELHCRYLKRKIAMRFASSITTEWSGASLVKRMVGG